jgi:hypothetical protein
MHESVLRDYFLGLVDETRLNDDLASSVVQTSYDVITHYVNPMDENFQVERSHLVKLCDAVLAGHLDATHLELIGDCLVMSEHFILPDESTAAYVVRETAYYWSDTSSLPALADVAKSRQRLLMGNDPSVRADLVG